MPHSRYPTSAAPNPGHREPRVVSGEAHERREPEPLHGRDPEGRVVREHGRVAAEPLGVAGRPAEHLAPPGRDVLPVLRADPAWEKRAEQINSG